MSSKGKRRKRKQWFYAVAVGKVPGVYDSWAEAERQVFGVKPNMHAKFRTRSAAEQYVAENRVDARVLLCCARHRNSGWYGAVSPPPPTVSTFAASGFMGMAVGSWVFLVTDSTGTGKINKEMPFMNCFFLVLGMLKGHLHSKMDFGDETKEFCSPPDL